jgi:hypothetical protein
MQFCHASALQPLAVASVLLPSAPPTLEVTRSKYARSR